AESEAPAEEHRAQGEAGADRRQENEIHFFQATRTDRIVEGQRNRGGRRIAEAFYVDHHLRRLEIEFLRRRHDNPTVGLMRDEQIEISRLDAVAVEQSSRDFFSLAHGELEYGTSILLHVVQALVN